MSDLWTERNNCLERTFIFRDFAHAFTFMTRVAFVAEAMNHHPAWSNTWNTVNVSLSTHDAGDVVTEKDRRLAEAIDGIYREFPVG
jgi:4a-hydroxytetrahydrobiopterin dehydratase